MLVLPMQTRRTLLIGVFLGAFLGTTCAAIASRALGADLTALPFVTNIYNGYKGNDSLAMRSIPKARSAAISSRRSRR